MHISITHTHTQTHTQAQAQAQARIGHTCNASLTQTQARTRTHAREPRTRTPARGRSATAARPRRRLHPALPRQLAGTAALHHPPSPNFYWRFFSNDANPLLCSPRKSLLPGIAFLWRVKDPQDLSLLTMRTRYPLLSCAVLVLHLVKSAAANAGGLSFGALSHHRIEWPCACPSLSLSP